ncbi:predicted protein [Uncinocarpus reesii 1704]|uniref:Enoyl reductase (ER) domain-containing protein n=1 Tax=Uncinocarpus reesii (strain UAMH 1704) TaxID=336963 RepID=C4JIJ5_UNCRE|nr:uncharacterized protein UREG_01532 [Uncinocarpus reesii 1704]EEP76683.1 predicted protein [Uncinocarpus reesii 1704]
MDGITAEKVGEPFRVASDLPVFKPGPDQILVKSIYTAINPVDHMMRTMGVLVRDWPLVPGVDAAGVVVEVGSNIAGKFKIGDHVCGCTRLGTPGHGTCQQYFLMDANVTIPKPKNLSLLEAATVGVGLETAALALFDCLDVKVPTLQEVLDEKEQKLEEDEWAVVLGGSTSVGKFAIQLFRICGYKVLASCSAGSAELVKKLGAEVAFNYKEAISEQVKTVLGFTKGKIHRVFDAAATGDAFAKALFKELPQGPKLFSSTNTWSGISDFEGGKTRIVEAGALGNPDGERINKLIEGWIPVLVALFEKGKLQPSPYDLIGEGGFESVLQALDYQSKGAGGPNKVVVKVQNE